MCRGFTFSQPAPPPPRLVRPGERLDHHALVPVREGVGERGRGDPRGGGHHPGHPQGLRHDRGEHGRPLRGRRVEQIGPVEVQHVEEHRGQRGGGPQRGRVAATADPGRGDLERLRPAVRAQRDDLAVEHGGGHRQRQHGLHHLGHPGGDVVQAAGVDRDVGAAAVHLDPGAVELPLHGRLAQLGQRGVHAVRGPGQHRQHRAADLQPEPGRRGGPAGERGRRHRAEVAAQHHRPAHVLDRDDRGLRDGVDHHPLQGALAQLADQQPAEEALLAGGGPGEQVGQQGPAGGLRAGARGAADLGERPVDLGHPQGRPVGGRRHLAQRGPADPDLPLPQLAGQERDRGGGLGRGGPGQHVGQQADLAEPRRGPGDRLGRVGEIPQQQPGTLHPGHASPTLRQNPPGRLNPRRGG